MAIIVGVDTYVTITEIDASLTEKIDSEIWLSVESGKKDKFARQACIDIESMSYRGIRHISTQNLSFPRDIGGLSNYMPENIKKAQIEQTFWLVTNYAKRKRRLALDALNISDIGISDVTEGRTRIKNLVCREALYYLKPYLNRANSSIIRHIYRG